MTVQEVERYELVITNVVETINQDPKKGTNWVIKALNEDTGDKFSMKTEEKPKAKLGMTAMIIIGTEQTRIGK